MAEQMAVVLEHIKRYFPGAVQSPAGSGPALQEIFSSHLKNGSTMAADLKTA
jgi:hypothetical protein